jgi:hypothetical protein
LPGENIPGNLYITLQCRIRLKHLRNTEAAEWKCRGEPQDKEGVWQKLGAL